MNTIQEGSLTFTFPDGCLATKYDDWSFHRNQFQTTCGGAKAVDILCIENNEAWLIEIKDYRKPLTKKVAGLHKTVAKKVRDTLAGLVAAKFNGNDPQEVQFAQEILRSNRVHIVLHVEQPTKHSKLFPRAIDPADLKQQLKRLVKAIDAHPKIVDQTNLAGNMSWSVTG
jgi:hypothetical protein